VTRFRRKSGGGIGHRPVRLRRRHDLRLRPNPDQVADREYEVGAVHGVEVQVLDAVVDQVEHLLGADGGGHQTAGRRVVLEALEPVAEPLRHARARAPGEVRGLLEVLHREDSGRDRNRDPRRGGDVAEAEEGGVVEKEVRDRARRAGVDLPLQELDVVQERRALGMFFGVGPDETSKSPRRRASSTSSSVR
jgi:hypothetical protein